MEKFFRKLKSWIRFDKIKRRNHVEQRDPIPETAPSTIGAKEDIRSSHPITIQRVHSNELEYTYNPQ
jgi:hypothetical protein